MWPWAQFGLQLSTWFVPVAVARFLPHPCQRNRVTVLLPSALNVIREGRTRGACSTPTFSKK
jgi:hypothetical protein